MHSDDASGFALPDMDASLDVEQYQALIPDGATVKGMFFQSIVRECTAAGHPLKDGPKFVSYMDYSAAEFLELLLQGADSLSDGASRRTGLRRLGQLAYPTLLESWTGRVIFGVLGGDVRRVLQLARKAYAISGSTGTAKLLELGDSHARLELSGIYSFLDAYHVGALEGALRACKLDGEVLLRRGPSLDAGEFRLRWWPTPPEPVQ